MKKYEITGHAADLVVKAFGETKEELFENALLGMCEVLRAEKSGEEVKREIKISSLNAETLLVDFLNEALYKIQMNREVYGKVVFETLTDTELEATFLGRKVKNFGEEIKATTYHNLKIIVNKEGYFETAILFDV